MRNFTWIHNNLLNLLACHEFSTKYETVQNAEPRISDLWPLSKPSNFKWAPSDLIIKFLILSYIYFSLIKLPSINVTIFDFPRSVLLYCFKVSVLSLRKFFTKILLLILFLLHEKSYKYYKLPLSHLHFHTTLTVFLIILALSFRNFFFLCHSVLTTV